MLHAVRSRPARSRPSTTGFSDITRRQGPVGRAARLGTGRTGDAAILITGRVRVDGRGRVVDAARPARPVTACLARVQGRGGHAPSQWLAHRPGRAAPHGGRPADEPGGVPGRPVPRCLHQRMGDARAQHLRYADHAGHQPDRGRAHVARARVASRRHADLCLRVQRKRHLRIRLRSPQAHGGRQHRAGSSGAAPRPGRDRERRLRRGHDHQLRRQLSLCRAALWPEGPRGEPRNAQGRRHGGARRRAVHLRARRRRADALRVGVGRRESRRPRRLDAGPEKGDRRGGASQRDGAVARRRTPLRCLREHECGVGRRPGEGDGRGADLGRARNRGARRVHSQRPRRVARRPDAAGRQRRQQHRDGGRRVDPGGVARARLDSGGMVPDRGAVRSRRRTDFRAGREGAHGTGQPAGAAAGRAPARSAGLGAACSRDPSRSSPRRTPPRSSA